MSQAELLHDYYGERIALPRHLSVVPSTIIIPEIQAKKVKPGPSGHNVVFFDPNIPHDEAGSNLRGATFVSPGGRKAPDTLTFGRIETGDVAHEAACYAAVVRDIGTPASRLWKVSGPPIKSLDLFHATLAAAADLTGRWMTLFVRDGIDKSIGIEHQFLAEREITQRRGQVAIEFIR